MIDIPEKAEVQCIDGVVGRSTYVIINPITHQITHVVVKSMWLPFLEYEVPIDQVDRTTPDLIMLKCTWEELKKMEPFEYEEYIHTELPDYERWRDDLVLWPYVVSPSGSVNEEVDAYIPVKQKNQPQGEIAVRRGAKVRAIDGYVGQVDELLVDSTNMHVTHLVMRDRHIFSHREITIPVSQIDRVDEDTVYMKLDRQSIEGLPTVPVQRWSLNRQ